MIDELKDELQEIRNMFHQKDREVKNFNTEIENIFRMKSKASRLLNELSGEKQKWKVCEDVAN